MGQIQFEKLLGHGQLAHFWRAQLCKKSVFGPNLQFWHRVTVEKPIFLHARPLSEADLVYIQDIPE